MGAPKEIFFTKTSITQAYFERPSSAMARIVSEAPYISRCSDNKTACLTRPRSLSTQLPYMQVNQKYRRSWLVFDIDRNVAGFPWEETSGYILPPPNLMVSNRDNGHCHLFYAITPVNTGDKGRTEPIAYMNAVYQGMAVAMKADLAYRGPVAKTPGHPKWHTLEIHDDVYSLGDLADYVELPERRPFESRGVRSLELADPGGSRHWALFRALCPRAYSSVDWFREHGCYASFRESLDSFAFTLNQRGWAHINKKGRLRLSQVRSTVRSVSRWTWDNYRGSGRCHRGVMALDASIPLKVRQGMSAKRTHTKRRESTDKRIVAACRNLMAEGRLLTFVAIAQASGLSRQTVAKYRELIDDTAATPKGASSTNNSKSVTATTPLPRSSFSSAAAINDDSWVSDKFDRFSISFEVRPARFKGFGCALTDVNFGAHQITRVRDSAFGLSGLTDMAMHRGGLLRGVQVLASSNQESADTHITVGGSSTGVASLPVNKGYGSLRIFSYGLAVHAFFGALRSLWGLFSTSDGRVKFATKLQGFDNSFKCQSLCSNSINKYSSIPQCSPENALLDVTTLNNFTHNFTRASPNKAGLPDYTLVGDCDLSCYDVEYLSNQRNATDDGDRY